MASEEAPDSPLLVNPTAYSPEFPFHPLGKCDFGNPFLEKNSFSCQKWNTNRQSASLPPSMRQCVRSRFILFTVFSYLKPRGDVAVVSGGENDRINI